MDYATMMGASGGGGGGGAYGGDMELDQKTSSSVAQEAFLNATTGSFSVNSSTSTQTIVIGIAVIAVAFLIFKGGKK